MPSLRDALQDLDFVVSQEARKAQEVYDRAAPRYEHFRELWLDLAGNEAEQAMLEAIRGSVRPGDRILDAGCGTGAMSRQIMEIEPRTRIVGIDISREMLEQAADVPDAKVRGDVERLPFASDSFDLVVSAWVIETIPNPHRAVQEFLRVLAPEGTLLYSFCSLPEGWLSRAGSFFLRRAVQRGFSGRFLERSEIPFHDCGASRLSHFHSGLTSLVRLRKCCHVAPSALPSNDREVPADL